MMEPAEKKAGIPTPIRLPPDLRQFLGHAAVDNCRSLTGEIVHRLQQSRRQEQAEQQGGAQ